MKAIERMPIVLTSVLRKPALRELSLLTALTAFAVLPAPAAVYTYTEATSTTTEWSAGTSWSAVPVSAVDTTLNFTNSVALVAGTSIVSDNDIPGNFLLNKLNFMYPGPAAGTAPMLYLTGNPLEFTGASATLTILPSGTIRPSLTISNQVVLSANLSIFCSGTVATPVTLGGKLTGSSGLTFDSSSSASSILILSNPLNDHAGNTTVAHGGSSAGSHIMRTGADEVIPNGVGKGNLVQNSTRGSSFQLYGHNETINGLVAAFNAGGLEGNQVIQNGAAAVATLTLGDNNASATFMGALANGSSGKLNVVKIGSGTQVLAARSTYTGTSTVSGGVLKMDCTQYSSTVTNNAVNYFPTNSILALDGTTTFAIAGRTSGEAIEETSVTLQRYSEVMDLSNANASKLVVGQQVFIVATAGTANAGPFHVTYKGAPGPTKTTIVLSNRPGGSNGASGTVTTVPTVGMTTQVITNLTLSGSAGSNATIDFGTSDTVVLTFKSAPIQINDGSMLTITNWSGVAETGGGAERLMFLGSPTDFSSVFSQSEVNFAGYEPGYKLIAGSGTYEVVAKLASPATVLILK